MLGVVGAFFRWAHPRSRGENWPHRRGGATTGGLIPAHAGKTLVSGPECSTGRAHPRSRGENAPHAVPVEFGHGSSPLTRGKRQASCVDVLLIGLIPAHAGKTRHTLCPSSSGTAHPRSRGENSNAADRSTPAGGSSPLTRGKLVEGARLFDVVGLIPAHAGKTPLVSHRAISRPAHPRSRGENEYQARKSVTVRGSSPLTRGKPDTLTHTSGSKRLIPAHAGKTRSGP